MYNGQKTNGFYLWNGWKKTMHYICKNINSIKKEFKDVDILESERIKWEEYPDTCIYNTCRRVFLKKCW